MQLLKYRGKFTVIIVPLFLSEKWLRIQTMKTKSSSFVLAAEILIITLFHVVKIKQSEKHPAEMASARESKNITIPRLVHHDKTGIEYMLVNLVK